MAFNPNPSRKDYVATAGQTIFTFDFKIFNGADVVVYHTVKNSGVTDVVLPAKYKVTITGDNGGTVTITGLTVGNGDYIVLERQLSIDRFTEYQTSGDLLAAALNYDQDYQTYLIADIAVRSSQAITVPPGVPGFSGALPPPLPESYLRWSVDGRSLENDTTPATWRTETEQFRNEAEGFKNDAQTAAGKAKNSDLKARKWAENPEGQEVEPGKYSALHWAAKAANVLGIAQPSFPADEGKVWVAKQSGSKWDEILGTPDETGKKFYSLTSNGVKKDSRWDEIHYNPEALAGNKTLKATSRGLVAGPFEIPDGVTLTVEDNAVFTVV